MTVYSKIIKRNRRQRLGRFNRQLVIRLSLEKKLKTSTQYNLVLTRRRSKADSRYDLIGTFTILRGYKLPETSCLFLNRSKLTDAMQHGAIIHSSVYKLLIR
jgi:ribosomal protein S16